MESRTSYPSKIYLVTPWFGTFAGGGERAFRELGSQFRRVGIEVEVLTTCSRSPYEDWRRACVAPGLYEVNGLPVRRFEVDQTDPGPYHRAVEARLGREVISLEMQEDFFTYGINSQSLIAYVGALPEGPPVIAGTYYQSLVPSLVNACPGRVMVLPAFHNEPEFYWNPIREMIINARKVLFLSEQEKALAIKAYGQVAGRRLVESPVVGLGVQLTPAVRQFIADPARLAELKSRYALPDAYYVYVGRIESAKGLSYLLPWMEDWNARRRAAGLESVPLVLVGDGAREIVPSSQGFVTTGYVSAEEKFGLIRAARALINPSTLESFSYVVMEAWLCGRPVLVPDGCAVTAAHCRCSGGGLVYEDQTSFFAGLSDYLSDDFADVGGAAGRQYVARNYAWPEVMDRVLRALVLP